MSMHNPPHPGEFIERVYLPNLALSRRTIALRLGVSPSTFSRLLKGQTGVSPEMALRLSKGLGRSPESWLAMQHNYDLWHARKRVNVDDVEPMSVSG
jgi:addiction module HigA family antidote